MPMPTRRIIPIAILLLAAAAPAVLTAQDTGLHGFFAIRGEQVLEAENAERLFVPASVQKLIVATAMLHFLGPKHRIATTLGSAVEPRSANDGEPVLRGDLVVVGAGDPSWNENHFDDGAAEPLRSLASQLRATGLRRIEGDLVVDASRFPGRRIPIDWPARDASLSWGSAPSALSIDENLIAVDVAPGRRLGDAARIDGDSVVEWVDHTVTVSKERDGRGSLAFQPVWRTRRVVVRGEYPISERPFHVRVASPDPDLVAGLALAKGLGEAGIELTGSVRVARFAAVPAGHVLASFESPPLGELVDVLLTDSSNFYAESLLRVLALDQTGEGRLDSGLGVLEDLLVTQVGLGEHEFVLRDASGLSPFDLLTPRAVVALLRWAWSQPWRDVLLAALPSPPQGTLRTWGRTPPMVAKSGTLQSAQTLAGVLDPEGPSPVFFAALLNHHVAPSHQLKREIRERLWTWYRTPVAAGPATKPQRNRP